MKKIAILGSITVFAYLWYGLLVLTAYHADDAAVFGESRQAAAHLGAYILAAIPPVSAPTIMAIKRFCR